ncbi:hypothetical protein Tco_0869070 [Tanacetum coccineum]
MCAILELHVDNSKLHNLCSLVFCHWDWTSNGSFCSKGTRIILGWNYNDVDVVVINKDDQAIYIRIWLKMEEKRAILPWCILRDFNAALFLDDKAVGFNDRFMGAHAIFWLFHVSDHALLILCIPTVTTPKPTPFKFFNILTCNDRFKNVVAEGWSMQLNKVQTCLDADPFNSSLCEEEAVAVVAFNEALIMEEKFLKQKAKVDWLREGDSNSAYFHKAIKSRTSRSRIDVVASVDGTLFENDKVAEAFVSHYEIFLGQPGITGGFDSNNLFKAKLEDNPALNMVRTVSRQEVKDSLFSMGNDKALVSEFFINGKILKELNHTIIALIPKVRSPTCVTDYHLISCCNVLFKCISKIIANRIKESLKALVSPNQSAFVSGRSNSDNILLTQELMHNYHLDRGSLRCAFKVDIQKAYDKVDWDFLKMILISFGFHDHMVKWITECVTTSSYSICINCSLHGYFKGKRGLRQGDPLSPYLFTLIMEILMLMLQRRVRDSNSFTYHRYCSELELINLCFEDDLFLFAHRDVGSTYIIKEALDEFKNASGLTLSLPKSTTYFCNVLTRTKIAILNVLPFEEGRLPVKYLDMRKGKFKVTWEVVCLPKDKGGHGLRRLDHFNMALMLRGRSFLDVPLHGNMLWDGETYYKSDRLLGNLFGIILEMELSRHYGMIAGVPVELINKYPFLSSIVMPNHVDRPDLLEWHDEDGNVKSFSVSMVWRSIRPRRMDSSVLVFSYILASLIPIAKRRSAKSVIAKLVVAACAYFIWQKRNWRLFKKNKRPMKQIIDFIMNSIRLKLLSCKFKKSNDGVLFSRLWKLHDMVFI